MSGRCLGSKCLLAVLKPVPSSASYDRRDEEAVRVRLKSAGSAKRVNQSTYANPCKEQLDRPKPRAAARVFGFLNALQMTSFFVASMRTLVPTFSRLMRLSARIRSSAERNLALPGALEIRKKEMRPEPSVIMPSSCFAVSCALPRSFSFTCKEDVPPSLSKERNVDLQKFPSQKTTEHPGNRSGTREKACPEDQLFSTVEP